MSKIAAEPADAVIAAHQPAKAATGYQATWLELYLFGILVLGKGFTFWQSAYTMGYWEFFMSISIVSAAYLCFVCCVAEMASILPFSGGSYGYVRCVLGPLVGYVIGFFETMEYVMFVAAALVAFGRIMTAALLTADNFQPVYWLLFYLVAVPLHVHGGTLFWKLGCLLAIWILIVIAIYCLGNAGHASMTASRSFDPQPMVFLQYFPVAGWCFKGIELLTLTCEQVADPGRTVPRVMMACICTMTLAVMSIVVITGTISPGPEQLVDESFPLDPGIMQVFRINAQHSALFFAPAVLGTTYCFLFAAGHQVHAMASSGLFPPWLKRTFGPHGTPYLTLLVVATASFAIETCLFYGLPEDYLSVLFTLSMMSSLPVYLCLMAAYCIYHDRFSNLDRAFRSPLGKWGAYYALAVYGFAVVTLVVFPKEVNVSSSLFVSSSVLAIAYYFLVARKRQFFSKEEQKNFLKVYVVNANHQKHLKKGRKGVNSGPLVTASHTSLHRPASGILAYLMRAQLGSVAPSASHSHSEHASSAADPATSSNNAEIRDPEPVS